jgi:hypothetical protein
MEDVSFKNLRLDPRTFYFVYVGEIKAIGLNVFYSRAFAEDRCPRVGAITIAPDVFDRYPYENVVVINPEAAQLARRQGRRTALRIPGSRFAVHVSNSPFVQELFQSLAERQGEVPVWMFESKPEFTLRHMPGVNLLGPDATLAYRMNDKTWQYETFSHKVPVVDFRICVGVEGLMNYTASIRPHCPEGIFVSYDYSAGGSESLITYSQEEVAARFTEPFGRYLVSRYVGHEHDPTVLACVANEDEVYVAGVADQRMENGHKFRGSTYPSVLPESVQAELIEHTRTVGRTLARIGYRGIYGCDFITDKDLNVYFVEVNPRKQGTTMEFCCTLDQISPPGSPSLMELEYHAVTRETFPGNTVEPDRSLQLQETSPIHWGTYNFKVETSDVYTTSPLPQDRPELSVFRRVARGGPGGYVFLEHVGENILVKPGTFLARIAAADSTREGMLEELAEGEAKLRSTIMEAE